MVGVMSISKEEIVLWKRPWKTINYFLCESAFLTYQFIIWLRRHLVSAIFFIIAILLTIWFTQQLNEQLFNVIKKEILWSLYWIGLGVLSSVGLGTGLHTFVLYLGPHIAKVTLAAYECGSLGFPEPPYPDEIVCPEDGGGDVSLWDIMSKVRLEAFMWGAGTALGELPPYFMARMKRLSGSSLEELDGESREERRNGSVGSTTSKSDGDNGGNRKSGGGGRKKNLFSGLVNSISDLIDKASSSVQFLVQKVGFFGILFCASFPNPVYDLAGITCGHFLVPFWTFFGATLIGKAVIKMHLQKLFVIIAFNESLLENFLDSIKDLPVLGFYLYKPFREFLMNQKERLHGKVVSKPHWIASVFEKLVMAMIIYFILSIINSLAQKYHSRITSTSNTNAKSTSSPPRSTTSKSSKSSSSSKSPSPNVPNKKIPSVSDAADSELNKRKRRKKSKD